MQYAELSDAEEDDLSDEEFEERLRHEADSMTKDSSCIGANVV